MHTGRTVLLLIVSAFLVSCDSWQDAAPGKIDTPGKSQSESTLSSETPKPNLNVAALEKDYLEKKQKFEADASARSEFIEAAIAYADALNFGPGVPSEKYPKALAVYEEVLAVDASNRQALQGRRIIIEVYESMGKEVPKTG
jgi:hypothetical protein